MSWIEQELKDRKKLVVTEERSKTLDSIKAEVHPIIVNEAAQGTKPFEPLKFQPVRSPGHFEAEFAKKGSDVIFHFWPWGLHEAERNNQPRPPFDKSFRVHMHGALYEFYDSKLVVVEEDRDMGSFFAKVIGAGTKQFWFDMAIKCLTNLHYRTGGE